MMPTPVGSLSVAAPPIPSPSLPGELDSLHATAVRLQEEIDRLEARLSPVLRADEPTPGKPDPGPAVQPPPPFFSEISRSVYAASLELNGACARIGRLLDRIDL